MQTRRDTFGTWSLAPQGPKTAVSTREHMIAIDPNSCVASLWKLFNARDIHHVATTGRRPFSVPRGARTQTLVYPTFKSQAANVACKTLVPI
jgi:hypothetical protein